MNGYFFVCKKLHPIDESYREEFYRNFVREIKIMHKLNHDNVVRIFNFFLYPQNQSGYIVMEYIEGTNIEEYLKAHPERVNETFLQCVEGFSYLESRGVLHRDIRPLNILVSGDGTIKIIDLGFGKKVDTSADFNKSISLNWWCVTPEEFVDSTYNYKTELYFLGKLFEQLIVNMNISGFRFDKTLAKMCQRNPAARIDSFLKVKHEIRSDNSIHEVFSQHDKSVYQEFVGEISALISEFQHDVTYYDDTNLVARRLEQAYRNSILEEYVANHAAIVFSFVNGGYFYRRNNRLTVQLLKDFFEFFLSCSDEKRRTVLANLHSRFDIISRKKPVPKSDDELPF